MGEGFENKNQNVKVELEGMTDNLGVAVPTPEELDEMFHGMNKVMPITEQATESESEVLHAKVKGMFDSIGELDIEDGILNYKKLMERLVTKKDEDILYYYVNLLTDRISSLTALEETNPKRKQIMGLKSIKSNGDAELSRLRNEKAIERNASASQLVSSEIENL